MDSRIRDANNSSSSSVEVANSAGKCAICIFFSKQQKHLFPDFALPESNNPCGFMNFFFRRQ